MGRKRLLPEIQMKWVISTASPSNLRAKTRMDSRLYFGEESTTHDVLRREEEKSG